VVDECAFGTACGHVGLARHLVEVIARIVHLGTVRAGVEHASASRAVAAEFVLWVGLRAVTWLEVERLAAIGYVAPRATCVLVLLDCGLSAEGDVMPIAAACGALFQMPALFFGDFEVVLVPARVVFRTANARKEEARILVLCTLAAFARMRLEAEAYTSTPIATLCAAHESVLGNDVVHEYLPPIRTSCACPLSPELTNVE